MRENVDLERNILLYLEEHDEFNKGMSKDDFSSFVLSSGFDERIVSKHLELLYQRNLIDVFPILDDDGFYYDYYIKCITAKGYDFIASTRNNEIWEKIKDKLADKGLDKTLAIVLEYLPIIVKSLVG